MTDCKPCDINIEDVYERNKFITKKPVYVTNTGELTLDAVDVMIDQFSKSVVADTQSGAFPEYITKYGFERINEIRNKTQDFIINSNREGYDALNERIQLGDITNVEICEFMKDNLYTPDSLDNSIDSNQNKCLNELNSFYNGSWATSLLGGFCGALNDIFGAAGNLFNMIGKVGDLLNSALSTLNQLENLKNPLEAAFEKIKIKALIEGIKTKIKDAVKNAIEKVESAVENFSLEKIFGDTAQKIGATASQLRAKITREINKVKAILQNKDTLLAKVEGMIDYTIGKFNNPSLKSIELLVTRMCGFAASIEEMFENLKKPLERIQENAVESEKQIRNNSLAPTAEAVQAGAIRLDDKTTLDGINRMIEKCKQESNRAQNRDAARGSGILPGNSVRPSDKEIDGVPSFKDITTGGGSNGIFLNPESRYVKYQYHKNLAWEHPTVKPETKARLVRLVKLWGKPVNLTNAWRSQEYNNLLRRTTSGVAKHSRHMQGDAFDLQGRSRWTNEEVFELAWLARKEGWGGIGIYINRSGGRAPFLHVDLGPARMWKYKPQWAEWVTRNNNELEKKYGLEVEQETQEETTETAPQTAAELAEQNEQTAPPAPAFVQADYSRNNTFIEGWDFGPKYDGKYAEFDLIAAVAASDYEPVGTTYTVLDIWQGELRGTSRYKVINKKGFPNIRGLVNLDDPEDVARWKGLDYEF